MDKHAYMRKQEAEYNESETRTRHSKLALVFARSADNKCDHRSQLRKMWSHSQ